MVGVVLPVNILSLHIMIIQNLFRITRDKNRHRICTYDLTFINGLVDLNVFSKFD